MDENPYAAPETVQTAPFAGKRAPGRSRPLGVSILAVIYILVGVVLFVLELMAFLELSPLEQRASGVGLPPSATMAVMTVVSALAVATGSGMWLGARWGWWLACLNFVQGAVRNAVALVWAWSAAGELQEAGASPEQQFGRSVVAILVSVVLLAYFSQPNILKFFGLARAIGILLIASTVLTALFWWVGWV